MKQTLIDIMNAMMPYMKWPVWVALGLGVLGVLLILRRLVFKKHGPFKPVGWLLILIGVFYLACQGLGLWLGMSPQINFADPTKFQFVLVPFWQIGGAALLAGILFRLLDEVPAPLRHQR